MRKNRTDSEKAVRITNQQKPFGQKKDTQIWINQNLN